jgi:hypothetical protein
MANEDLPGGVKPFARQFSLVRPPRDRQFRAAQLKVERSQRKAQRRLRAAFDDGGAVCVASTAELSRIWSSASFSDLRADLPPQEIEQLQRQLIGVLSGEISLATWHATISALREVPRAAEVPVGARPRKWRQSYPDLNGW